MLTTACSIGNGAVFFICHFTISCRSAALDGTFSSRSSETFATVSGMTSDTCVGLLPPSCVTTPRTACASAGTSGMFGVSRPGTTMPAGSRSEACAVITAWLPRIDRRAAATCVRSISTATSGAGVVKRSVRLIRRTSPC
jgi:hypothetical protein